MVVYIITFLYEVYGEKHAPSQSAVWDIQEWNVVQSHIVVVGNMLKTDFVFALLSTHTHIIELSFETSDRKKKVRCHSLFNRCRKSDDDVRHHPAAATSTTIKT